MVYGDSVMEIRKIPIDKINPAPYNPRKDLKPGDPEYEALRRSIDEFTLVEPLVWNEVTGNLVGGHQRLKVLKDRGVTEVEVSVVHLDEDREKALNVALNKIQGKWDEEKLAKLIGDLSFTDVDVTLTGFSEKEITELITRMKQYEEYNAIRVEDRLPDEVFNAQTKVGDFYQLGRHKLLCGDATKKEDIEKLILSEHDLNYVAKHVVAIYDPPYGVNIIDTSKNVGRIGGRGKFGKGTPYKPIMGDDSTETARKTYEILKEEGVDKFIIFGGNYMTDFLPPSKCWIVWDKIGTFNSNIFADCELAWTSFDKPSRIVRYLWHGAYRMGNQKDELKKRIHPTQKPVCMFVEIINRFTEPDSIILDPFGGSGSTLIASEKTGRRCYMMELDPYYCDVIVKRWETYTGQKAVKLDGN